MIINPQKISKSVPRKKKKSPPKKKKFPPLPLPKIDLEKKKKFLNYGNLNYGP
jgi:hypothetical protein